MTDNPKPWGQPLGTDPARWPVGRVVLVETAKGARFSAVMVPELRSWSVYKSGGCQYVQAANPDDRWMEWPTAGDSTAAPVVVESGERRGER